MKKILATSSLVLLLAFRASASLADAGLLCTETGTRVESCCCVEEDGNQVCTLTGDSMPSCCCVSEN